MIGPSTRNLSAARRRHDLQARISRLRRRMDRRVDRLVDQCLLVGSWRTYVEQHPARSLLAAAGVGVALSAFVSGDPTTGRLGTRLYEAATGAAWSQIWRDLQALFARHEPGNGTFEETGDE